MRGSKCFFAHGEEELRKMNQGMRHIYSPSTMKRKVFVGGLHPLLDSG